MGLHASSCIFFLAIFIIFVTSDRCIQQSPCTCEFEDEKIISLKPLSNNSTTVSNTYGQLTYYFHPCSNKKFDFSSKTNISNCNSTSLCAFDAGTNTTINLGNATEAKFARNGSNPALYDLIYLHKNISTMITLVCTGDFPESILYAKKPTDDKRHNLVLFSSVVCAHYEYHGLSTGSVLVILFMIFLTTYFLGGALVLHCLRGARGREMIPNIDFWTDLPLLVKDGVVFLQNGCKSNISSNDSYDRI